jgi:hypothetical protein
MRLCERSTPSSKKLMVGHYPRRSCKNATLTENLFRPDQFISDVAPP